MMYLLYGMKQAVVCEINGHAPAAGTILALCCDSRVAAPGVVVGMYE
jgi:enoyl-CoA hydratase/carnithine racemase